jgi:glycerate 2-kinase
MSRRVHAEAILRAAIAAAEPAALMRRALHGASELEGDAPVRLLAIGKAAPAMAEPVFELFGSRITASLIVAPAGTRCSRPALFGAHPLPDASSLAAGRAVHGILRAARGDEIVLVLLSGGASATAALPRGDVTVAEYADCVQRLLRAGADIGSLNTVRRHLDALKGGRMAELAAPARVLGLVLSDVVGDPVETIASGPLTPDPSTAQDALRVLQDHGVIDHCAASIIALLTSTPHTASRETTQPDRTATGDVRVRIIGGNDVAVTGAAAAAEQLGYRVRRATGHVTGLARDAGATLAAEALEIQRKEPLPTCIVAGGETTVAVRGSGRGGRNQEIVLAACIALNGAPGITVGSIGTDGVDGPTDAAGAIADETTLHRATARGVDASVALEQNDSYTFFCATEGVIRTGPTGTNVNDVQIALIETPVLATGVA